jgi:molecular chaperone Hsp33
MEQDKVKKINYQRDRIVRLIDKQGYFRAALIKNTMTVLAARSKHNLTLIPAFFLGKVLTASSLIASFLKGEERIVIETESEGLIDKIFAEAMQVGEVRGFIRYDDHIKEVKFDKLQEALGQGHLKVSRILYNKTEPITGVVPIYKGDIGSDVAYYFVQSEQIPTAVILEVNFNDTGEILSSGGLLVQALPEAPANIIHNIYIKLSELKEAGLFRNNEQIEDVLKDKMPFSFNVVKSSQVDFFCRCSKNKFLDKLITLSLEEINSMENDGQNELVCQYCNSKYKLDKTDFDWLRGIIQTKFN